MQNCDKYFFKPNLKSLHGILKYVLCCLKLQGHRKSSDSWWSLFILASGKIVGIKFSYTGKSYVYIPEPILSTQ